MLGAIFGDIVGSVYEFQNTHDYNFRLLGRYSQLTDDSYMTLAVAKALMESYGKDDDTIRRSVVSNMQQIGRKYPHAGYGGMFSQWLWEKDPKPYNSFGNGSAMRVSAAGWLYQTMEETLHASKLTAEVTHDHPEGIKGAQAIAATIFLARAGAEKYEIANYIADQFEYNLFRTLDEIRPKYRFYEICQKSVPEAIIAFLEGESYEDVIRKAVSLGGDSDTIACMAGSIAEAYYGMPEKYRKEVLDRLDAPMRSIVHDFRSFYRKHSGKPHDGWQEDIKTGRDDPSLQYNPLIEKTIDEFYAKEGTEDAVLSVYKVFLLSMSEEGNVLVPVETPENAIKFFNPSTIRKGDTVTVDEDLHWKLIHIENPEGKVCMPVFTSEDRKEEAGLGGCSEISISLKDYMMQVLEMENSEGILINPGKRSFFLGKKEIRFLLDLNQRESLQERTSSDKAFFKIPEMIPEGFAEAIAEQIRNKIDEVEKAWLTGLVDSDEESLCIAIKTRAEDTKSILSRLSKIKITMDVRIPIDYMVTEEAPWPGAQLIYERE